MNPLDSGDKPPSGTTPASGEGAASSATTWRLSPEERAAARAHSRRRRLTWIGLSIAWVAAVVAVVLILTSTIGH